MDTTAQICCWWGGDLPSSPCRLTEKLRRVVMKWTGRGLGWGRDEKVPPRVLFREVVLRLDVNFRPRDILCEGFFPWSGRK
jgi:hypothetical protein